MLLNSLVLECPHRCDLLWFLGYNRDEHFIYQITETISWIQESTRKLIKRIGTLLTLWSCAIVSIASSLKLWTWRKKSLIRMKSQKQTSSLCRGKPIEHNTCQSDELAKKLSQDKSLSQAFKRNSRQSKVCTELRVSSLGFWKVA